MNSKCFWVSSLIVLSFPLCAMYSIEPHVDHIPVLQKIGAHELTYGLTKNWNMIYSNDIFYGCRRAIKKWLKKGADINCCSPNGSFTPLSCAAIRGEFRKCEILLELGADVNGAEADMTPMAAVIDCVGYRKEIFELFMRHGADLNIRSKRNGKTPLMEAVRKEFFIQLDPADHRGPILQDLLSLGADPFIADINGNNALMYAAYYGVMPLSTVPIILRHIIMPKLRWVTFLCCLERLHKLGTSQEKCIASALKLNRHTILKYFLPYDWPAYSLRQVLSFTNQKGLKAQDFARNPEIRNMLDPERAKETEQMLIKEILGKK